MKLLNLVRIMIISALLLIIPLIAKLTVGMDWSLADFVIFWILLTVTGIVYKLLTKTSSSKLYKIAAACSVMTGLLLIWTNLAVGLIGNENNPANLLYFGVIAVALIGLAFSRLQPKGIEKTLYATAAAQALVPFIAMIIWKPPFNFGLVQVLGVNFFFVALWLGSALLFRRARLAK